jgi:pimeloyl-ACP methyl ester carboxylesterase
VVRRLDETASGFSGLIPMLRGLLDSLDRHPVTARVANGRDTIPVGLGKFDVQLLVSATLGDRRQMAFLPRLIGAASRGNYSLLAGAKLAGARSGITSPYEAVMDCQTGATPARSLQMKREALTSLLGAATLDFPEVCAAWGVKPLDDSFRRPVTSSAPVLLISGTLDGRTPVRNANDALRSLPNGAHLIIDGASHGDDLFLSSPEIVPVMLRFLTNHSDTPRHLFLKAI